MTQNNRAVSMIQDWRPITCWFNSGPSFGWVTQQINLPFRDKVLIICWIDIEVYYQLSTSSCYVSCVEAFSFIVYGELTKCRKYKRHYYTMSIVTVVCEHLCALFQCFLQYVVHLSYKTLWCTVRHECPQHFYQRNCL